MFDKKVMQKFLNSAKKHIANIPGWRTNRKIVVFLVDDYGSIRIASKQAQESLKKMGIDVESNRFNRLDTIARSNDLEALFETITSVKDKNGKPSVFTLVSAVANPDFSKIEDSGF